MIVEPTPVMLTNDVSTIETMPVLSLEYDKIPPLVSVFVDDGSRRNESSPYVLVMDASVITGRIGETTNTADISNCPRLAVAACVAVMTDEPAPMIVTVLPPGVIVATSALLLVNVNSTVLSLDEGFVRLNEASP